MSKLKAWLSSDEHKTESKVCWHLSKRSKQGWLQHIQETQAARKRSLPTVFARGVAK